MDKKKRILVADDSITIQKLVNISLGGSHFDIILAHDGHDALMKLQRLRPEVLLLDADLRDLRLDSLEEELKREGVSRVVWMCEPRDQTKPPSFAQRILEKPFDAKALSNLVYDLLEDEETTVVPMAKVARPALIDDEEETEKVRISGGSPSGPFSSFRKAEEEPLPVPQPVKAKLDLSSRLESIAQEVVSAPSSSQDDDEEDTVRVAPEDFESPVSVDAEETLITPRASLGLDTSDPNHESLAREMISQWMEENLPAMAERLLKEEISKMVSSR